MFLRRWEVTSPGNTHTLACSTSGCRENVSDSPRIGATDGFELPCGSWEPTLGPLQGQLVLLTTEPTVQLHKWSVLWMPFIKLRKSSFITSFYPQSFKKYYYFLILCVLCGHMNATTLTWRPRTTFRRPLLLPCGLWVSRCLSSLSQVTSPPRFMSKLWVLAAVFGASSSTIVGIFCFCCCLLSWLVG